MRPPLLAVVVAAAAASGRLEEATVECPCLEALVEVGFPYRNDVLVSSYKYEKCENGWDVCLPSSVRRPT